jgi:hypothetical protein
MTPKEILLLKRYSKANGSEWNKSVEQFCANSLNRAKNWARTQKVETIDDLLANTEVIYEGTIN